MRELHVVALSEDGRSVVLATRKGASRGDFKIAIDDRLSAAVRGDLQRPGESTLSPVTPKEIQARLRAGESVEQIAQSAGMAASRVERFAGPVFSERERMIAGARAAVVNRTRRGPSGLPLGDAVDQHLVESPGYKPASTQWTARREETGRWLVEVVWISRAKQRSAAWRYDASTREVTPVDAASAALAHVDAPAAPREAEPAPAKATRRARTTAAAPRTPSPRPTAARATPAAAAPTRATAHRPAAAAPAAGAGTRVRPTPAARPAAVPATRPAVAAKPAKVSAAKPPAAKTAKAAAAAKPAAAKPAKAPAAPAAQATEVEVATVEVVVAASVEAPTPVPSGPPTLRVVPAAEPDEVAEPVAVDEDDDHDDEAVEPVRAKRAAGQRASVPTWADVLLGITPTDPPRRGPAD